jgi:hypothetical protein
MHPFHVYDFRDRPDDWKKIISLSRSETMVGGSSPFYKLLANFYLTVGYEDFVNNPYIRMMRYYLKTVFKDAEPFIETPDGQIGVPKVKGKRKRRKTQIVNVTLIDSMASTRFLVLARGASFYHNYRHILTPELIHELTMFIFDDPYKNMLKVKSAKSVITQAMFCISSTGKVCVWHKAGDWVGTGMKLVGYDWMDANDIHCKPDYVYYGANKERIQKDVDSLVELGLVHLANMFKYMIDAPLVDINHRRASLLQFIESYAILRSRIKPSILNQYTNSLPYPNPTMEPYVYRSGRKIANWAITNNRLPSNEQFLNRILSFLTPKSSGVNGIKMNFMLDGEPHSLNLNDKITVFLANPLKYLNKDGLLPLYTVDSPAKFGIRQVPARPTRGISIAKLGGVLSEAVFVPVLADYETENPVREQWLPLGTSKDFRLGSESGVWAIDHAAGLFVTSNYGWVGEYADYSTWDASTRKQAFKPFADGIIDALNEHGVVTKYGVGDDNEKVTLQEIEAHHVKMEGDAWYVVPDMSIPPEDRLVHIDCLGSGKLRTLAFNNIVNQSLRMCITDARAQRPELHEVIELKSSDFVGDDSASFHRVNEGWNVEMYKLFNDIHVDVAADNGYDLNWDKSVVSSRVYENLKRLIIAGVFEPRNTQLCEFFGENVVTDQTPMAVAADLKAYLNTMVSRGTPELYAKRWFNAHCILNRSIKMRGSRESISQFILPLAFAYTPRRLKGAGGLPFSIYGASVDSLIAYYCQLNSSFNEHVNAAAHVLNAQLPDVARGIVKQAFDGTLTLEAKDGDSATFQNGLDFITNHVLLERRLKQAVSAQKKLESEGVGIPSSLYYPNAGENLLRKTLMNSRKVQQVQFSYLRDQGNAYHEQSLKPINKDYVLVEFAWVKHLRYEPMHALTVQPQFEDIPWALLDNKTRDLFRIYGFNFQRPTHRINPEILRRLLAKDKHAAALVQPETVYNLLADDLVAYSKDRIILTLMAMGISRQVAYLIALEYDKLQGSRVFKANASSQSFGDQLLPLIAQGTDDIARVVQIQAKMTKDVYSLFGDLGVLFSVTEFARNGLAFCYRVPMTQELNESIYRDLQGKKGLSQAARYIQLYEYEHERNSRLERQN